MRRQAAQSEQALRIYVQTRSKLPMLPVLPNLKMRPRARSQHAYSRGLTAVMRITRNKALYSYGLGTGKTRLVSNLRRD